MGQREQHIFLHCRPMVGAVEPAIWTSGPERPAARPVTPFPLDFEGICRAIEQLPGAYCEPDGAIGWNPSGSEHLGGTILCGIGNPGGNPALPSGSLTPESSAVEQVVCLELFSSLSRDNWRRLLGVLAIPPEQLEVQLAEQGLFLGVEEYTRRFLCEPA